jgi:hypothetical protein
MCVRRMFGCFSIRMWWPRERTRIAVTGPPSSLVLAAGVVLLGLLDEPDQVEDVAAMGVDRSLWTFLRTWAFRRRHAPLLDALRRSTELLDGVQTDYGREEVAYIKTVNRRLLRHYDPAGTTDRAVR